MSLLIFHHQPTQVALFTDTLGTTPEGEPLAFFNKSFIYPHFSMIMAVTGIYQLADAWDSKLNCGFVAEDVDMINTHAPKAIRAIWKELLEKNNGKMPSTSTIYHFGWSNKKRQYVRYVYRSEKNFESELYEDAGIGIKPQPTNKGTAPETIEEVIATAETIRKEQMALPKSERIYIGGELYMTLIGSEGIIAKKVHKFDDYEDAWTKMNDALNREARV